MILIILGIRRDYIKANLELYRVFYHTAKEKQISKAAKKLFISQPAVSQSIKLLESSLETSLFVRSSKGVKLTNEGEELYQYIEKAFSYILEGEDKILELNNLEYGEIRIGASDTLCSHYLISFLKDFHQQYPKIKIKIFNKTSYAIINLLKSGDIDLGFINLPIKEDKKLYIKKIKSLKDCFICGSKYKDYFKEPIHLSELTKYPLLLLEKETNMRRYIDNLFRENNINYNPELELGSIDVLSRLTAANFGISFVTEDFLNNEQLGREIFKIDVFPPLPQRSIGLVTVKDRNLSYSSKAFYNQFISNL